MNTMGAYLPRLRKVKESNDSLRYAFRCNPAALKAGLFTVINIANQVTPQLLHLSPRGNKSKCKLCHAIF